MKCLVPAIIIGFVGGILISCEEQSDSISMYKEQVEDLESEADNIEEDFYITYNALQKIDTLLISNDVDSARRVIKVTLSDLGGVRFHVNETYATDMLNLRTICLDTSISKVFRDWRLKDYAEKREIFLKTMKDKKE